MLDERYDSGFYVFLLSSYIIKYASASFNIQRTLRNFCWLFIHLGTLRIVHDSPLSHLNGLKLEHLL